MSFKFFLIFLFWGNVLFVFLGLLFHLSVNKYIPWWGIIQIVSNFLTAIFIWVYLNINKKEKEGKKKLNE